MEHFRIAHMKYLQILIVLFLVVQTTHSQKRISDSDIAVMKAKIENEVADLRKQSDTDIYTSAYEKQMNIDFMIDTYRIDTLMARMICVDYSRQVIAQAASICTVAYDKLLNKYYKMLMTKLSIADQETLKLAQRNWIQYRDSEIKLINTLSKTEYAGLDQRLFGPSDILYITERRAITIYYYLMDMKK